MKKEELRIIYMGTPDFAVESLKALVEGGYNVVGVVTMPDKAIGRHGSVLQASPVKKYAVEHGIKVLQPTKLKDEQFIEELRSLQADIQIVVAFRMLPEIVWNMPRLGTFNLHASLLPQYRGAAPINWAIINGDTETGITTFFLKHEIDTGDIIQQVKIPIGDNDNVGDIHDKLMILGGKLVTETVDNIINNNIHTTKQDNIQINELRPAPKIFHDTCHINWEQSAVKVHNFIRGLSPYPAAWSKLKMDDKEIDVKIFETRILDSEKTNANAGEISCDGKTYMHIACSTGTLEIRSLQIAGKKRMNIIDFLRGFKYDKNALLC